jgi:Domain of unknown function (DUF4331)
MKKVLNTSYLLAAIIIIFAASCSKSTPVNNPTVYYSRGDEVGRPGIATVFVAAADKDTFNGTIPSVMGAAFQAKFQARLLALNSGYTTNALGLTAAQFTTVLSTDVLNLAATGATTYGTLTGRGLSDDVIHTSLVLIFGGPSGSDNPTLNDDHVPANDKAFLTTFPYLASPW